MHTERLVATRGLTPQIYSNKVGKVDLGFAFHYSLNEKFQEWVKKNFSGVGCYSDLQFFCQVENS